ncbi:hypothetical protein LSCM1_02117 [Leishmania martiniquensis]|uniref:Uncharacterized protein n=1 Tax=Leishmania martiniquensis TaxID=1580590 RepID=A0A836KJM9_9TRYP|nr:hypothetical protein LSCM1_02117 [Leishmania martiniquensis]
MRTSGAARAAEQNVWPQRGAATAKKKSKEVLAGGVAGQSARTRSMQIEAAVRHVAQLPAFVAWAPDKAAATPSLVGKYLESQVAQVAAQLKPIQQAGNYERLLLLLAELLDSDLAAGLTPRAVEGGVLDLMHGCAAAIVKGESDVYDNPHSSGRRRHGAAALTGAHFSCCHETAFGSTSDRSREKCRGIAVPIESLLPPLIDQPAKGLREVREDAGEDVTEDERTAAEMEIWETFMATSRAAATAEGAMRMPGAVAAATTVSSASGANAAHSFTPAAEAGVSPLAASSTPIVAIRSFPDALCALIERCTATPLVCLTLSDQQCQATAVRDLLRALLSITQGVNSNVVSTAECGATLDSHSPSSGHHTSVAASAALDLQAVRMAAWKGISRLLSRYLDGADSTAEAPTNAPRHGQQPCKAKSLRSVEAWKVGPEQLDIVSVFEDVTHQWSCTLAVLAAEKGLMSGLAVRGGGVNVKAEGGPFGAPGSSPGGRSGTDGSGPGDQLYVVLCVAHQIIAAEQRETTKASPQATPHKRLLPPLLIPVVLRTLSMISAASPLACRAASYAQLCVDVLWGATLLAPRESARQLLYGSMDAAGFAGACDGRCEGEAGVKGGEASPPAMDLFLALLQQFNEGHSAMHCELRDDLVCLLASLLRYDIQYVEDELGARRAAESGVQRVSFESLVCPATSPPMAETHTTPLTLSAATVEAINATVALLFETTCGAELTTTAYSVTATATAAFQSTGSDGVETFPAALLSLDAARRHALRFQSIATSVARRRELLDFKVYGWQLLAAHCSWQLAHLTYREYIRHKRSAAPTVGTALSFQEEHTASLQYVAEENPCDGAVTAALWGMQLSQLGFVDVLLMYVDMRTDEAAVVAWTQEELLRLEAEAWQLLTSMILFTQHLRTKSGGLQARYHHPRNQVLVAPQPQQRESAPSPCVSCASVDECNLGNDTKYAASDVNGTDDDTSRVLYGADKHFIDAGGVPVALHYLLNAPPEAESVKRWALITLAAIAGPSDIGEARGPSGAYASRELERVQTALTQHARSLILFLVKLIQEVNVYVDAVGVPGALPPLISSVAASAASMSPQWESTHRSMRGDNYADWAAAMPPSAEVRWNWLPQSVTQSALVAWYLLRCIGDATPAEEEAMREQALDVTGKNVVDAGDLHDGENEMASHEAASTAAVAAAAAAFTSGASRRGSLGHDRAPLRGCVIANRQLHDEAGLSTSNVSSSGSSMGPLEVNEDVIAASDHCHPAASSRAASDGVSASCTSNEASALPHGHALLSGTPSEVLCVPNLFAEQGGVDLLTAWLRHVMRLCLPSRPGRQRGAGARAAPQLTAEEVERLARYGDTFLLLLDVFRAIVMGCNVTEVRFVDSGGVHGVLDLIEAYALAHGLVRQASRHARLMVADSCVSAAVGTADHKEQEGVLYYATTLLCDLLQRCPRAIGAFAAWRSSRIAFSPLTPDVYECRLPSAEGIGAVQLFLCLWAAKMPAPEGGGALGSVTDIPGNSSGLELLRVQLRPALRAALKEEYVCRLLRRRAKLGAVPADSIRNCYRYLHSETVPEMASRTKDEGVPDASMLAYMEKLLARSSRHSAVPPEQQIALLIDGALGLCIKVYGCLSTVGFDSLRTAEASAFEAPSMGVRLSSLERSFLVQIAALPALCVDEIIVAMAEVALGCRSFHAEATSENGDSGGHAGNDATAWRPTTPDQRVLRTAAQEAAVRAGELNQIIDLGAQVQQVRESQLYSRLLVTQLRQPVGRLADGRPGAVKGMWKSQRCYSVTRKSDLVGGGRLSLSASKLASRLSARFATEQLQRQQLITSTMPLAQQFDAVHTVTSVGEAQSSNILPSNAPCVLGSYHTPYASLMESVSAATHERLPALAFNPAAPPSRHTVPVTQRHQQRQAMIARSLRKLPLDEPTLQAPRKP